MGKIGSRNKKGVSRRSFIKSAAAGGAALIGSSTTILSTTQADQKASPTLSKPRIELAGYDYDRVRALLDARVQIEGCDTQFEISSIGEMNTHVFSGPQTRELTEIGLHPFMLAYANDGFRDYTLIPVFPLRLFRHKSIFIRNDRGINKPEDLRGKRIATPGYSSTSLTWIRGIVQHEYGVTPDDIQWVIASKDSSSKASGSPSKQESVLPEGMAYAEGPEGQDESDLLESGAVDALFHAAEPRAIVEGHPKVARLFPDYRRTERDYFSKTGIFPIMHAVAIRKDVAKQRPWLPEAVFNAYSQAKQLTYDYMQKSAWYKGSLPWFGQEFEETRKVMGENYWSYGIASNRKTLEALFQYSHEQGLTKRKLTTDELFHPSTVELNET